MESGTTRTPVAGVLNLVLFALFVLGGCASPGLKDEIYRPEPSYALPPATSGKLADLASTVAANTAADESGFLLLDPSYESLLWRLALIDSAETSLDIITYLWYPDHSGKLLLERAMQAAKRGVQVRLIVDDLLTIGQDEVMADLESQPNIELRLFNPWKHRSIGSRAGEMITELKRLNVRMHDKLLIADGRAMILGGRNIGDHYFGLSEDYNFRDLDVLGVGPVAEQTNAMFDHFWTSEPVISTENLTTEADPERARESWERLQAHSQEAPELASFPRDVKDWSSDLDALAGELHIGASRVVYDRLHGSEIEQDMGAGLFGFLEAANEEVLITNAYVIPGERAIELLASMSDRDVDIRILTNSLASHDVPAVNAHYEKWRDDLILAGVDLYEFRSDPAVATLVNVPPVAGKFTGLHTKAAVIDAKRVFIGSMNLDPRSANINTEMGVIVESPTLAAALRDVMLEDMRGENAWHLSLDDNGDVLWTNSDETLDRQPARGFLQRVMNIIFKIAPADLY